MSYSFDFLVGKMKCPHCGNISNADTATNMQTKICREPDARLLGQGAILDLDIGRIEDSGYDRVIEPKSPTSFSIIDIWSCPNCHVDNSALIVIRDSVIDSVKGIVMNEENVKQVNYASDDCVDIGWKYINGALVKY